MNKFLSSINRCLLVSALNLVPLAHANEDPLATDLSVEDLLNVEVTSVAKKTQSLNDAAAAVYVISNEDIKRSGATNLPDALRLAPGLDVARINSSQWAVSSRGFNGRFSNKMLVLIDGRNLYTRSFAGVYWENQDVMLEDVDRIEIIRGPGAALWGANAVNGVINVVTRHSSKSQGGLLTGGGGNQEGGFGSLRYGFKLGEDTTARAYIKGFDRNQNTLQAGGKGGDAWDKVQGGFRVDSQLSMQDTLTVQGDVYHATIGESGYYTQPNAPYLFTVNTENANFGGNILGRFQHTYSPTSDYSLQFYYDGYSHKQALYEDSRHTLDLQFQHRFALFDWHEIIWGASYNFGHDHIVNTRYHNGLPILGTVPSVNDQVGAGFIQDEMSLIDNELWLTIGSRLEHNDYSGFEGQPFAKVMWAPHNNHRFWAGVSRAVRTPSRVEHGFSFPLVAIPPLTPPQNSPFPTQVQLLPNPEFKSERVIAYEAGYRTSFFKSVSLDVAGFYNNYNSLRGTTQGTPVFNGQYAQVPISFNNDLKGHTYGIEVATVWQMLDWWRWDLNYSWLETRFDASLSTARTGVSPQQRASIRGSLSLEHDIDLDFWFRYVDKSYAVYSLGDRYINDYVTLDLRAAWRPLKSLELSVVGQNLLAASHMEYISEIETIPTFIDRSIYGKVSFDF